MEAFIPGNLMVAKAAQSGDEFSSEVISTSAGRFLLGFDRECRDRPSASGAKYLVAVGDSEALPVEHRASAVTAITHFCSRSMSAFFNAS